MGEGKYFAIRSQLNGLVLDVKKGDCCEGQEVVTWEHHGGDNQLWYEDHVTGVIRCKHDDSFVLEMKDGKLTVNTLNEDEPMQQWRTAGDRVALRGNPDLVLDIHGASEDPGANICIYEWHGNDNQRWSFDYQAPVYVKIRSELNGRYLDVSGADTNEGASVIVYDGGDGDNQLWWEDSNGVVRSKLNDFSIDTSDGKAVMMPFDISCPARQWVKHGDRIANKLTPNECLDIEASNDDNGAGVIRYEYSGSANQRWTFEYV